MGRKCCVPGCKANYNPLKCNIQIALNVFAFPKDEELRQEWLKNIPRKDTFNTDYCGVCILHFNENQVQHCKKRTVLTKNAVPTLFFYGNDDDGMVNESDELSEDIIRSYEHFTDTFPMKLDLRADWNYKISENGVYFYDTKMTDHRGVYVKHSIFVGSDLKVKLYDENHLLNNSFLRTIIHNDSKVCYFSEITKLMEACDVEVSESIETIFVRALSVINEAQKFIVDTQIDFEYENVVALIQDQLILLTQKRRRYSTYSLLYAYSIYLRSSGCYALIRDENILVLPHVTTLTSMTRFQDIGVGSEASNINYLKKIADNLSELEKVVTVQVDEIYCASQINFKASTLTGFAENADAVAKTVIAFMISSCFGSMKEIAALIPVSNPIGDDLHRYHKEITSELHSLGYKTLVNVTDDNRLNQKLYSLLAPDRSHEYTYTETDKTYLIYDSIHVAKNVRNNWLNKKDHQKTFWYPHFDDFEITRCASFVDLRNLHRAEFNAGKLIAKAYKLNKKTLYPSNFERQRVPLLLNILHPTTIAALKDDETYDLTGGTSDFLELWRKWFTIMNNRSTIKGFYENDVWSTPIKSKNDFQVDFLRKFAKWLRQWRVVDKAGVGLTSDTFDAAIVTTEGMVKLIEHSFDNYDIEFFLPGKFQTNDLEKRFGKYRGLCGSNYLVSYKDIMEAENKLRIKHLVSSFPQELNTSKYTVVKKEEPNVDDYMCILNTDFLNRFKNHDYAAFLYVCGYGAYSYMQTLSCTFCRDLILKTKGGYVNDVYFDFLQRGGLVIPSENCHIILLHMNSIIDELLRTDHIKRKFQLTKNQHSILVSLTYKSFNESNFIVDFTDTCICEKTYSDLFYPLMKVFANILLNNYRKHINNTVEMEKQQKSMERAKKRKQKEEELKAILVANSSDKENRPVVNSPGVNDNCLVPNVTRPAKRNRKALVYETSK